MGNELEVGRYTHQQFGAGISLDGTFPQYQFPTSREGLDLIQAENRGRVICNSQSIFLDPKVSIERVLPTTRNLLSKLNSTLSESNEIIASDFGKYEAILWVDSGDRSKIYDFDIRVYPELPDLARTILLSSEEAHDDPSRTPVEIIMDDIVGRLLISPTDFTFERNEDTIFIFDEDGIRFTEGYDANPDGEWSENSTRIEKGATKLVAEWIVTTGKIQMSNVRGEIEYQSFTITAGVEFATDNFPKLIKNVHNVVSSRDYQSLQKHIDPFVEIMFTDLNRPNT